MAILDLEDKSPEQSAADAALLQSIRSRANTIFILSLISILFCCLGGLVASFIAHRAKQDADMGNLDAAKRNIDIAMVIMIVTYVIGLGGIAGQLNSPR